MRHAPANGGNTAVRRWGGIVLITALVHSGMALAADATISAPAKLNEPDPAVTPTTADQPTSALRDIRQPEVSGDEHGTRVARTGRSVLDKLKVNGI